MTENSNSQASVDERLTRLEKVISELVADKTASAEVVPSTTPVDTPQQVPASSPNLQGQNGLAQILPLLQLLGGGMGGQQPQSEGDPFRKIGLIAVNSFMKSMIRKQTRD